MTVFSAIQRAVLRGIVVIEPTGNGGENLDSSNCNGRFDRSKWQSGAIMVGGGKPPSSGPDQDGARWRGSMYGDRVDVQAWGEGVYTTRDPDGYSGAFDGTSAAASMVAGAAINLQSIAIAHWNRTLSPQYLRQLLVETGSEPSGYNEDDLIGRRVNLKAAIERLFTDIPLPGDMNGDHRRNGDDVESAIICYLDDIPEPPPNCELKCDVNENGECDIADVSLVLQVASGLSPDRLPVDSPFFYFSGQCQVVRNKFVCSSERTLPPRPPDFKDPVRFRAMKELTE